MTQTTISHLSCEYHSNPVGIDVRAPRLSWRFDSNDFAVEQSGYQILVADSLERLQANQGNLWDTGRVTTGDSIQQPYRGFPLNSRQRCYWKVRAWVGGDQPTSWSEPVFWEMGLLDSDDWQATWITPDEEKPNEAGPSPLLRKNFYLNHPIACARVYASALGLYELWLNGKRVGDQYFTPGWTSYHHRLQYQTYDVTDLLEIGENTLGAILGDGWYRGRLGWEGKNKLYGARRALLLQLEIRGPNSESTRICSDETWKTATSPILKSNIYDGEIYDARLEQKNWNKSQFDDSAWTTVFQTIPLRRRLDAQTGPPVRAIEQIQPKDIINSPAEETIFDFGQNMVGWVRLKVSGTAGTVINLRHAEVLDAEGNLYTENLRSAKQLVQYTLKGQGVEIYQPRFSFQGFRYVAIEGYPGTPTLESLTGIVLHSDMPRTGYFTCSDSGINKLYRNIVWSQKGNFLDIPTDCPQRDERLGWTGDAQVFAQTAAMNMDVAGFFTKWLQDLAADQREDGSMPHVVPDILPESGSSGWGDAATIVPWVLFQYYGDTRILSSQYESMTRWVAFILKQAGDSLIWNSGFHFGDWLASSSAHPLFPKPVTNTDLIATAFFAHSTDIMARTAAVLCKTEDAEKYSTLFSEIKSAFNREFVSPSGRIASNTQAAYVLPLMFDLLPETKQADAASRLVDLIQKNDDHLSTGFVSTPYICHVLTHYGYEVVAYKLLKQESPPSWMYAIKKGATTIWEHWDSIKPDGNFQEPAMNSFNHYANGAVGDWLYQVVAGIRPAKPGFKCIVIQPHPGGGLTFAEATYISMHGEIASSWEIIEDQFILDVRIPCNTRAEIWLPDGSTPIKVGSGQYQYSCLWSQR